MQSTKMILIRHICVLLLSQQYLIQSEDVHQHIPLTTAEHGGTITLQCVISEEDRMLYWYKQTIGHLPQRVADEMKFQETSSLSGKRISAKMVGSNYDLNIQNLTSSDEGIYICQTGTVYGMNFRNGTFVTVRGNHLQRTGYQTVLQQPESEPVHPGDSVTLQCSVLSESSTGQHSVFWFRAGAGESHPGLLYTQGDRSEECEKRPETPSPTRSCVYSLSKNNLNSSDSGTYYCAVATCGEILFGNGTILDVKEPAVDVLVIVLGVSLAVCVVLIIILICTRKALEVNSNECDFHRTVSVTCHGHDKTTAEQSSGQEGEDLNYAALQFSEMKGKRGRRKRETPQESVYSDVRGSDWEGSGQQKISLKFFPPIRLHLNPGQSSAHELKVRKEKLSSQSTKMILIRHILVLLLSQLYLIQSEDVLQHIPLTTVEHDGTVILRCVISEEDQMMYWYKQTLGHLPQRVAAQMKFQETSSLLGKRISAKMVGSNYDLNIQNITSSDEGIYFCATGTQYRMDFRNGTFVIVRGNHLLRSHYQTVLKQPESEPVHPGDSVTLQCSVLSESCTEQHSVFWFRAGAGKSHPGLLYTQGDRSEECEKRPETPSPTRSCVYSLSKNNLSSSDSGTYYCAVATCGEILLGNGTRLDVKEPAVDLIVIVLGVSLAVCVLLIIILICTRKTRTVCESCKVSVTYNGHDKTTAEQSRGQEGEDLNYAALQFSEMKGKRGRRKRETPQESVYSDVRGSDWEGSGQ
ncbi:LOW QUALITY PROTEIN: uncharacterized protein LOC124470411 [Hypomesus transpacificus]|uniref:LOW QUALITY PROTEIN: uncharacterized protein LOC124470411 n=1 Tax=Hypomesus transpacificus TaxID=137520 RepID=UPI001F081B4E|nr:LOW QUALITY PROTEIN: uncharacterized protein LOC124470411 [Hypomesus transpacificus]